MFSRSFQRTLFLVVLQTAEPLPRVRAGKGSEARALIAFLTREGCEWRRQPIDDNVSCIIKSSPISHRQHVGIPKGEDVGLELLDHLNSRSEITSVGSI
jgi:hypothetical protein